MGDDRDDVCSSVEFVHEACRAGRLADVERAFDASPYLLNAIDNDKWTGLLYAALGDHLDVVNALIWRGAHLDAASTGGWTALHTAAHNGRRDVAEALLHAGASVELKDGVGDTARDEALREGKRDVVAAIDEWANKSNEERTRIVAYTHMTPEQQHQHAAITAAAEHKDAEARKTPERITTAFNTVLNRDEEMSNDNSDDGHDDDDDAGNPGLYVPFKVGDKHLFRDGTEFRYLRVLGTGASATACLITIDNLPRVIKLLENYSSIGDLLVPVEALSLDGCFPFGGKTRREDYDLYCKAKGLVDPDARSIDKFLEYVVESFSSWDIKVFEGGVYSIGAMFDVVKRTEDPYRDIIRFCYQYFLLQGLGIAHCDVSPRNVLLTFRGPVMIDFGSAAKFDHLNGNIMPKDVTPQYYLDERGRIEQNHDIKGMCITARKHFGLLMDDDLMAKLEHRNDMTLDEAVLNRIRMAQE